MDAVNFVDSYNALLDHLKKPSYRSMFRNNTVDNSPVMGQQLISEIDKIEVVYISPPITHEGNTDFLVGFRVIETFSPDDSQVGAEVDILWGDILLGYTKV